MHDIYFDVLLITKHFGFSFGLSELSVINKPDLCSEGERDTPPPTLTILPVPSCVSDKVT